MLETVDLKAALKGSEYKAQIERLDERLATLQRAVREARIPIVLVVEGWQASGVGTVIGRLLRPFDPRGYRVHMYKAPNEEERLRPPMWRFWLNLPRYGGIIVFDRSWYAMALERTPVAPDAPERIRRFERQLTDDGAIVAKFWLHIGKREQEKRFKEMMADPARAWRVSKEDWRLHRDYEEQAKRIDTLLSETETENAPWTVVAATDRHHATVRMAEALAQRLDAALKERALPAAPVAPVARSSADSSMLDRADLSASVDPEVYKKQLPRLQKDLFRLESQIFLHRIPVIVAYEGWDASGKGGNIRRMLARLDRRGYEVIPVGAPEGDEKAHHYMWRFWRYLPKAGHMTIFDRTWYGRVLVERVEGFATPEQWQRAYREINEFEYELTSFGTVLVKFWIHISKDEQLARFQARQETPAKQWKITDEDWRNREKWDGYYAAVSEMLERTSTACAPWTVIEGNCKLHARIKALKTVNTAIAAAVRSATKSKSGRVE